MGRVTCWARSEAAKAKAKASGSSGGLSGQEGTKIVRAWRGLTDEVGIGRIGSVVEILAR